MRFASGSALLTNKGTDMQIAVQTTAGTQMIDITSEVQSAVTASGIQNGWVHVFSMHTTAAVTINENADPSVEADILGFMNKMVPREGGYRHREGNSAAHIKVSLFGPSETIPLENGRLVLGTWQGIYFCEFDGPRKRRVNVSVMGK